MTNLFDHPLTNPDEWYPFAIVLRDADLINDGPSVMAYFESPWDWAPEYDVWCAYGKPLLNDPTWAAFEENPSSYVCDECRENPPELGECLCPVPEVA